MVTTQIGCDDAEQMAQSVLAVAEARPPVANCLRVVVPRSASTETELAAAEVATARSAAANLRQIESELLAEIEEIIGRADSPQLGDEQALRELHAMLAKARVHVRGPLARAEERAAQRLAAARLVETTSRKGSNETKQPEQIQCQRVAEFTRRTQLHVVRDICRAWCSHCRCAARARRLVEGWRSARLRTAFHRLHDVSKLLAAQRKQESYRLALSELQARMAMQEASRAELVQRLAEAGTEPAVGPVDLRSPRSGAFLPERVLMAVEADTTHSLDVKLATSPLGNAAVAFCELDTSGDSRDDSVVLGMIKLCGHRRQETHGMFCRPYLIYQYEVSVGPEVWQGEKRYTDFEALHHAVVETLGAEAAHVLEMRSMELPPKRYVGNLTTEVGDNRLLVLQHYLTQLGHLASPEAAENAELPQKVVSALHCALVQFVRQQHEVVAADFVVAAAASYFERIEHLREAFAKCDTQGTGRLTEAEISRFLADSNLACAENSDVAAELRELRGSGLICRLKNNLAAEVAGSGNDGLTLVDVESWWSQHCLRTQSTSARN